MAKAEGGGVRISEEVNYTELTPAQLQWAAEYVTRWRNMHPDDVAAVRNEIEGELRRFVICRAIALAVKCA